MKDTTEVKTAGPNTRLWIAATGATEPANVSAAFGVQWTDMGFLSDPPAPTPNDTANEIPAWNSDDPIRTLLTTTWSVDLKLMQTNRATYELYFGPLTYTVEGAGVSIEPNDAASLADKAMCLELVDGADVLRVFWRKCTISQHGPISMDKAAAIIYEVTLQRLAPTGATKAYRIQTNVASLLSA